MSYNCKNYTAHGGNEWRPSEASAGVSAACGANGTPDAIGAHGANTVIGGKLTFLPGATVEGGEGLFGDASPSFTQLPNQAASEATTVSGLKESFNSLLSALKTAGLMVADVTVSADEGGGE